MFSKLEVEQIGVFLKFEKTKQIEVKLFKIVQIKAKRTSSLVIVKKRKNEKKRSFNFFLNEAKKNEYNRSPAIEDLPLLETIAASWPILGEPNTGRKRIRRRVQAGQPTMLIHRSIKPFYLLIVHLLKSVIIHHARTYLSLGWNYSLFQNCKLKRTYIFVITAYKCMKHEWIKYRLFSVLQTCSGEPMTPEEMARKDRERQEL